MATTGLWLDSPALPPLPQIQLLKKVVPLVVDDDEGRKVFYFNLPDRFHAQAFEGDAVDLLDAVLGEAGQKGDCPLCSKPAPALQV